MIDICFHNYVGVDLPQLLHFKFCTVYHSTNLSQVETITAPGRRYRPQNCAIKFVTVPQISLKLQIPYGNAEITDNANRIVYFFSSWSLIAKCDEPYV